MSRRIAFDSLPLDICDRVLTFLPDFLSLQCATLSSKRIYDAYSSRKRSIVRAVEFNEVGPALPFAVALVRTRRTIGLEPLQTILEGLNDESQDSGYWAIDVTAAEATTLAGVAVVVQRLESFFCILYKDRAAPVSTLPEVESLRFHRAIYWLWIISALANDRHQPSVSTSLDMSFLSNICEEEFVEIHEAMLFLDVLYRSLMIEHSRFHGLFRNTTRPPEVQLDELLSHFDGNVNASTFGTSLSRPAFVLVNRFRHVSIEKQIAKLFQVKYSSKAILIDSRIEIIQACQKCDTQTSELFGENNWHLLHPTLDLDGLLDCLPGMLNGNGHVKIGFSMLLERRHSFTTMFSELFDSQNDPESGWNKSDWLCVSCIKAFLSDKLLSWVIGELVKNGHQFKENCWYGWNCRTQTHRPEHAKKLNHLCEPTDRDDTGQVDGS